MAAVPPDRARAVHDELAGLQQQVRRQTPPLRSRRRDSTRKRLIHQALRLLLAAVIIVVASVIALDVGSVRTDTANWYQHEIVDPSQGR